jgi:hypothetical protein
VASSGTETLDQTTRKNFRQKNKKDRKMDAACVGHSPWQIAWHFSVPYFSVKLFCVVDRARSRLCSRLETTIAQEAGGDESTSSDEAPT